MWNCQNVVHAYNLEYTIELVNDNSLVRDTLSDSIWAGRFGVRTPVAARYSASFQTGPKAQAASCKWVLGFYPWGILAGAWS